jgi:hypothetical protein
MSYTDCPPVSDSLLTVTFSCALTTMSVNASLTQAPASVSSEARARFSARVLSWANVATSYQVLSGGADQGHDA